MNIYEKLGKARVELQNMGLTKSGFNKYAGYKYFELRDFLPAINELQVKFKFVGVCAFGLEIATLTIVDMEKPEDQIVFTSPMSTADLKGCHAVQDLGAVETYLRRYLWTSALEIVEGDALDSTQGKFDKGSDEDPLGTGNTDRKLPPRGDICQACGAALNEPQAMLAKKYAPDFGGLILCPDCRAKEGK